MNRTDYLNKVKSIIVDAAIAQDADSIEEGMSLKGDLGCDSLDITMIVSDIEEAFDIDISDSLLGDIRTVGDIVDNLVKIDGGSDKNE